MDTVIRFADDPNAKPKPIRNTSRFSDWDDPDNITIIKAEGKTEEEIAAEIAAVREGTKKP